MRQKPNYFLLNKKMDFVSGTLVNARWENDRLILERGRGRFVSKPLDSGVAETKWHSMELFAEEETAGFCVAKLFASDRPQGMEGNVQSAQCKGAQEFLIPDVRGRYLWFELEASGYENQDLVIEKIRIKFDYLSWSTYLPDLYRQDKKSFSFVERYLGIFQSIYEEMTQRIESVAACFDPEVTQEGYLDELAQWMAIEDSQLWEKEKLRRLVSNAAVLYARRGTARGMLDVLELYLGRRPYLVEYHQVKPYMTSLGRTRQLEQLYGMNRYQFTVIIEHQDGLDKKERRIIARLIENEKPAHMECQLVVLEQYFFLGLHTYLGMNSVLSDFRDTVLDGQASIPFTKL